MRGTTVHALAERLQRGEQVEKPPGLEGHIEACVRFLDDYDLQPVLAEAAVLHRANPLYGGTLDLVGDMLRQRWLIDWKTLKSGVYAETALQLAAYAHADIYVDATGAEQPVADLGIERGAVVHLRADGYDVVPMEIGDEPWLVFRHAAYMAHWLHWVKGQPTRLDGFQGQGAAARAGGAGMTTSIPPRMRAELAVRGGGGQPIFEPSVDLEEWASRMGHAGTIARALAPTAFVPRSLRVFTDQTNREIRRGGHHRCGCGCTADGHRGGAVAHGGAPQHRTSSRAPLRCGPWRCGRWCCRRATTCGFEEATATRAIVKGTRAGTTHEQQSIWTLDRAKAARLVGKPNWQNHPLAMLVARATAECARLIAPDVLLGLPYSAEELADGDTYDDGEVLATAAPEPKRTAQRRQRADRVPAPPPPPVVVEPQPEPVLEPDGPPVQPDDDGVVEDLPYEDPDAKVVMVAVPVDYASKAAVQEVVQALRTLRAPTDLWLDVVADITGRHVGDLAELYTAEARSVVDALRGKVWKPLPPLPEAAPADDLFGDV